ncbi:MAG: hypothetical protein WCR49_03375 [Opitutae bacterium]
MISVRRTIWIYCAVLALPLAAFAVDARLAGYWVSAPDETEPAVFTVSVLGKWMIVSQHWANGPADVKVRYLAVSAGDGGTLNADDKLDKLPDAPRTIRYELQNGELLLSFPGTAHAGRYRLLKSTPPSAAPSRPSGLVDMTKTPASPVPAESPARQAFNVLGSWTTEPGVERQLSLFLARSRTADLKINQQWTKGSDNPLVSKNSDYAVAFANGRGTFTQVKPDYEGSAIPPVLNFTIEGERLIVTVDAGAYAGQYRLTRRDPHPKEAPAPRQN